MEVRRRDVGHAVAVGVGPAHGRHRVPGPHRYLRARRRGGLDVPVQPLSVKVRRQPDALHIVLRHALQPHRLPDAAGGGVPDAAPLAALLAHAVHTALRVVGDGHGQPVLTLRQQRRDVEAERQITALVAARLLPVHQHAAALIHRAEVQQHPLPPEPLRQGEHPLVPQRLAASQLKAAAGQQALRREGHQNFPGIAVGVVVPVLHRVVPQAVEAQIAAAHQLGPGILRQRACSVQRLAPRRIELLHTAAPLLTCFRRKYTGAASSTSTAADARKISAVGTCFTTPSSS